MLVLSELINYDYNIANNTQYAQITTEVNGLRSFGELFIDRQHGLVLTVNDKWYTVTGRSQVQFILDFIAKTTTTVEDIQEVWSEGQTVDDIGDFLEQSWDVVQSNHALMQINVVRNSSIVA